MSYHRDDAPVGKDAPRAERSTGAGGTRGTAALFRCLLRCNRGAAAVEFGLSAPVLLFVLVPVADLGIAFSQEQQLRQAVQAGAQSATGQLWSDATSPAAITAEVTAVTALTGVTVSPPPYRMYGCPAGTGITPAANGSVCTDGQAARPYVVVSAQLAYRPILPYSLLGSPTTLTAQARVRIQ
jgi:Flp pilus assembly protein TadG